MTEAMSVSTPQIPENFVAGLEGVVAFTTEIAEPDKDGGALRYRGVDIEDLVSHRVTFGDVWAQRPLAPPPNFRWRTLPCQVLSSG